MKNDENGKYGQIKDNYLLSIAKESDDAMKQHLAISICVTSSAIAIKIFGLFFLFCFFFKERY